MIASVTASPRSRSRRKMPVIHTSTIASGASANSTRYAMPAACCVQRS